jgi:signal peptidase II
MSPRTFRTLAVAVTISACFGCDHASKRVAVSFLPEARRVSLLGDVVRLELVRNAGAFLGAGAGLSEGTRTILFVWGNAALILGALAVALRSRTPSGVAMGAALVAGGGVGNLWDRATGAGLVIDFLNLGVGPVRTGIFNVADVAVMAGVVLLALRVRSAGTGVPSTSPRS